MLQTWQEKIPGNTAHFRQLAGLPGNQQDDCLRIQQHTRRIVESINQNSIIGVRSPPGSGKTMFLPEVLRKWAVHQAKGRREQLNKAVMIVFPTQFGCLKIRDSLVEYRNHPSWRVTLRTGIDKEDWFSFKDTQYQVVTYGMLWHWLAHGGEETQRKLFKQNCAFL